MLTQYSPRIYYRGTKFTLPNQFSCELRLCRPDIGSGWWVIDTLNPVKQIENNRTERGKHFTLPLWMKDPNQTVGPDLKGVDFLST